jgi:xanthine dehydrogenase YagR molybdenum-binding subunit
MASTKWPTSDRSKFIAKSINRLDGPPKTKGEAKYAYDITRPQMLVAKILGSPHAHARILSIDTSEAERMPGVRAVHIMTGPGAPEPFDKTVLQWEGFEIAAVAADTEEQATDALRAIKVEYEVLPHFTNAFDLTNTPTDRKPAPQEQVQGDINVAFQAAAAVVEGSYGMGVVGHCCLEAHGQVVEWKTDDSIKFWPSTQGVSNFAGGAAQDLKIPAGNIEVSCQYMGGGFGSKFNVDRWGIAAARLAKAAGRPVKLMLERGMELMIAGTRPSAYGNIKVACDKDGNLTAWESLAWGTSGVANGPNPPLPYVFTTIPNQKKTVQRVSTNLGPARAWRAPNHPQAALLTMAALDDLAAAINMDPLDFMLKNLPLTARANVSIDFPTVYREELMKAAEMIEWKRKWHPRGQGGSGAVKTGLGLSIHTWNGSGHASQCMCIVNNDGTIELRIGTQDLGTGTRTVLNIVAAETFGVPLESVVVKIGENTYPPSGNSGGSSTIGGISSSSRRACTLALNEVLAKVAPTMGVAADQLEAIDGVVRVIGNPARNISWKDAAAKIGPTPISVTADRDKPGEPEPLYSAAVGGVQMVEVSVDTDTGVVRVENMVAVQDVGLVMSMKTCQSQVYGCIIMGICSALYEESIVDHNIGRMLNPNMEFYKLAGIGDIGKIQVHMMTGPGYDERGPVGVGEPPASSPISSISNAIANAIGVRVQYAPFTPDRVLAALEKGGRL